MTDAILIREPISTLNDRVPRGFFATELAFGEEIASTTLIVFCHDKVFPKRIPIIDKTPKPFAQQNKICSIKFGDSQSSHFFRQRDF